MEPTETPIGVSYLFKIAAGKWKQEGDKIDILLDGGRFQLAGGINEILDESKSLRLIVEAPLAKP
jgi:hypothetical protein